jgi:hypothetical protein
MRDSSRLENPSPVTVQGSRFGVTRKRRSPTQPTDAPKGQPGDAARQPGLGNRAARADLRIGSSGDGPGSRGAANPERGEKPQLRPNHSTGNRRVDGAGRRADVERGPQLSVRQRFGRRYCDGTVYRVSVNGVDGANGAGFARPPRVQLRQRGPRQRAPRSGVSGNGGRFAGQPGRGGTVIGKPIWRRGGNGVGFARQTGLPLR